MKLLIPMFCCAFAFGQSTSNPPVPQAGSVASPDQKPPTRDFGLGIGAKGQQSGALDILSDTQGVDFGPYLKRILQRVRENWYHLIPSSAEMKKGKLAIEFAITKDGEIADMRLVASSGDRDLDRPAWGSITASNPFPALPSEFTGPFLALRFRFYYNPDKSDLVSKLSGIKVSIWPASDLKVPVGGSEVVSATVTGTKEHAVDWSIKGSGCSGSACGKIVGDLYVAPSVLPNPAEIILTAASKADPTATASVTVHIVQRAPTQ